MSGRGEVEPSSDVSGDSTSAVRPSGEGLGRSGPPTHRCPRRSGTALPGQPTAQYSQGQPIQVRWRLAAGHPAEVIQERRHIGGVRGDRRGRETAFSSQIPLVAGQDRFQRDGQRVASVVTRRTPSRHAPTVRDRWSPGQGSAPPRPAKPVTPTDGGRSTVATADRSVGRGPSTDARRATRSGWISNDSPPGRLEALQQLSGPVIHDSTSKGRLALLMCCSFGKDEVMGATSPGSARPIAI